MSTARYLALVADAMETLAGATTTSNQSPAGYWERIAAAAETLNGAATSASNYITGFMKRGAVAIDDYANFAGSGYNPDEEGYLAWMVAALEDFTGATTTGSFEYRLYTLLTSVVPGFSILLLEDGSDFLLEDGGELQLG
jgi:hypothetical protein